MPLLLLFISSAAALMAAIVWFTRFSMYLSDMIFFGFVLMFLNKGCGHECNTVAAAGNNRYICSANFK